MLGLFGGLFFPKTGPGAFAELSGAGTDAFSTPENKRYALLIGVDKYHDPDISIPEGQTKDVVALREVLIKYAGFSDDHVFLLTPDSSADDRPSRTAILTRLSDIKRTLPPEMPFSSSRFRVTE